MIGGDSHDLRAENNFEDTQHFEASRLEGPHEAHSRAEEPGPEKLRPDATSSCCSRESHEHLTDESSLQPELRDADRTPDSAAPSAEQSNDDLFLAEKLSRHRRFVRMGTVGAICVAVVLVGIGAIGYLMDFSANSPKTGSSPDGDTIARAAPNNLSHSLRSFGELPGGQTSILRTPEHQGLATLGDQGSGHSAVHHPGRDSERWQTARLDVATGRHQEAMPAAGFSATAAGSTRGATRTDLRSQSVASNAVFRSPDGNLEPTAEGNLSARPPIAGGQTAEVLLAAQATGSSSPTTELGDARTSNVPEGSLRPTSGDTGLVPVEGGDEASPRDPSAEAPTAVSFETPETSQNPLRSGNPLRTAVYTEEMQGEPAARPASPDQALPFNLPPIGVLELPARQPQEVAAMGPETAGLTRPRSGATAPVMQPESTGAPDTKITGNPTGSLPPDFAPFGRRGQADASAALPSPQATGNPRSLSASANPGHAEPLPFDPPGPSAGGLTRLPSRAAEAFPPPKPAGNPASDTPFNAGGLAILGSGLPGDISLEGPQTPRLLIEKLAPEEVQVNEPAVFKIRVMNQGQTTARSIEIRDTLPRGMELLKTHPPAITNDQGELLWRLGPLQAGQQLTVEVHALARQEGVLGSVASVQIVAEAAAKTRATKPELELEVSAPEQVLIGAEVPFHLTVSNPGSGVAEGVVVEAHLGPELDHPAGSAIMYEVGSLRPGETRELELRVLAKKPGPCTTSVLVMGQKNLQVEADIALQIVSPQLQLAINGPKRRFLDWPSAFELLVQNVGTAAAENVQLLLAVPPGFEFVSANNSGQYDGTTRQVLWLLEELPIGESGSVRVTLLPRQLGTFDLRLRAEADLGAQAEIKLPVEVAGIAALQFEVSDQNDPVALGGEAAYEIRVVNQGSQAASNVQVSVTLPSGLTPISAEGPVRHAMELNRLVFDVLPQLAPKAEAVFRLRAQAVEPGDKRFRVQLTSDDLQTPILKEESTRVFAEE